MELQHIAKVLESHPAICEKFAKEHSEKKEQGHDRATSLETLVGKLNDQPNLAFLPGGVNNAKSKALRGQTFDKTSTKDIVSYYLPECLFS